MKNNLLFALFFVIISILDDLLLARKKAKEAEYATDVVSDSAQGFVFEQKRKQKKTQRLISESASESESDSEALLSRKSYEDFVQEPIGLFLNSNPGSSYSTQGDVRNTQRLEIVKEPCIVKCTPASSSDDSNLTAYQKKTLSLLTTIKEQNIQILNFIRRTQEKQIDPAEALNFPVTLPLGGSDDCETLNEYLLDDTHFSQMCAYLTSFGGCNVSSTINRILKSLISDELASEYSFKGQKKKKSFQELAIKTAIIRSVRKNHSDVKDKEIEDYIKVWLKNAPTRLRKQLSKVYCTK